MSLIKSSQLDELTIDHVLQKITNHKFKDIECDVKLRNNSILIKFASSKGKYNDIDLVVTKSDNKLDYVFSRFITYNTSLFDDLIEVLLCSEFANFVNLLKNIFCENLIECKMMFHNNMLILRFNRKRESMFSVDTQNLVFKVRLENKYPFFKHDSPLIITNNGVYISELIDVSTTCDKLKNIFKLFPREIIEYCKNGKLDFRTFFNLIFAIPKKLYNEIKILGISDEGIKLQIDNLSINLYIFVNTRGNLYLSKTENFENNNYYVSTRSKEVNKYINKYFRFSCGNESNLFRNLKRQIINHKMFDSLLDDIVKAANQRDHRVKFNDTLNYITNFNNHQIKFRSVLYCIVKDGIFFRHYGKFRKVLNAIVNFGNLAEHQKKFSEVLREVKNKYLLKAFEEKTQLTLEQYIEIYKETTIEQGPKSIESRDTDSDCDESDSDSDSDCDESDSDESDSDEDDSDSDEDDSDEDDSKSESENDDINIDQLDLKTKKLIAQIYYIPTFLDFFDKYQRIMNPKLIKLIKSLYALDKENRIAILSSYEIYE